MYQFGKDRGAEVSHPTGTLHRTLDGVNIFSNKRLNAYYVSLHRMSKHIGMHI